MRRDPVEHFLPFPVILVEGDAERFLVPVAAGTLKTPLDHLGITVCSVAGTNFTPYGKPLTGLGIPFAVVTDWDPRGDNTPLGFNRSLGIVSTIEEIRTGKVPKKLIAELGAMEDGGEFAKRREDFGVFSNFDTLEVDLFNSSSEDSIRACGSPTEYGDRQSGGAHQVQNGGLRSACRF